MANNLTEIAETALVFFIAYYTVKHHSQIIHSTFNCHLPTAACTTIHLVNGYTFESTLMEFLFTIPKMKRKKIVSKEALAVKVPESIGIGFKP